PEFDEHLLTRCRLVESSGGRLLSPDSTFVGLGGDKTATAQRLAAAQVRVPREIKMDSGRGQTGSLLRGGGVKARDGAGSAGGGRVQDEAAVREHCARHPEIGRWRLEEYCPGQAASIAALGGPRGWLLLPPGRQILSDDGEFRYLGGEIPLESPLAERA